MEILTTVFRAKINENWVQLNRKTRSDGKEIIQYSKLLFNEVQQALSWPLKYDLVDKGEVIETEKMELHI